MFFLTLGEKKCLVQDNKANFIEFYHHRCFLLRSFWLTFYIIQIILSCQINWLSSQLSDKNHGQVIYCLIDMKSMYITVFQKSQS